MLKAFPTVAIKLGGYADNTGNPHANQKLSSDRANTVMNELIRLGINPTRSAAEGYGQQFPVGPNDTKLFAPKTAGLASGSRKNKGGVGGKLRHPVPRVNLPPFYPF